MTARRNFWSVGGKLGCLGIVLVPLGLAGPVEARAVYTVFPINTQVLSINDNGDVTGQYSDGSAFLRTSDGTMTLFQAPGASGTFRVSINANDDITGSFSDGSSASRGFLRSADGTIVTFDVPQAALGTIPKCVTASDTVYGVYYDADATERGFIRTADGTITLLQLKQDTEIRCANDQDVAVGTYVDRKSVRRGFVRDPQGTVTSFEVPRNSPHTEPSGINGAGDIAGYYQQDNDEHGFIRSADGKITLFDGPHGHTMPVAINSSGETTGTVGEIIPPQMGFIREPDGKITTFKVRGANLGTIPTGINSSGVIAGYGFVKSGKTVTSFGFIRTP